MGEEGLGNVSVVHVHTTEGELDELHTMRYILFFVLIWKGVFRIADNAINILLRFLKALTKVLWKSQISIPITLKSVMRKLGMDDNFKSFVVCPKCHSLYNIEDCIKHLGPQRNPVTKKCRFVEFPNHPQKRFQQPCNERLLKELKLASGGIKLVPYKAFCYRSVIQTLSERFITPRFTDLINSWHDHKSSADMFTDIYDGKLWKDCQITTGGYEGSIMIGFMLNVDWFNPFKHGNYSMGAIYLSI